MTPVLLQLVEANQGPCNPDDMQAILKKDAGTLQPNKSKGGGGGIALLIRVKSYPGSWHGCSLKTPDSDAEVVGSDPFASAGSSLPPPPPPSLPPTHTLTVK